MCLIKVTKRYSDWNSIDEDWSVGYKVFIKQIHDNGNISYHPPVIGFKSHELDKTYFAEVIEIGGWFSMPEYESGFHIFTKKEDAKAYLDDKNKVILKVKYRNLTAEGIQNFTNYDIAYNAECVVAECVVAAEMILVEEV